MLPVKNVELTKVHYFEQAKHHRNVEIPTISQEVFQNTFNRNVIIKKNIFGHKWVLKINEFEGDGNIKKRKSVRCLVYCVVFSCIMIAVLSGVFFTFDLEKKLFKTTSIQNNQNISKTARSTDNILENQTHQDQNGQGSFMRAEQIFDKKNESESDNEMSSSTHPTSSENPIQKYCTNCTKDHVCLKSEETDRPNCVEIVDQHDPTGCGGHCIWDVEFCAVLDKQQMIYQCSPLKSLLKCPRNTFNCGEQCISRKKVCDGIVHCKDMQDERFCDCDLEENFQCTNSTKCLPKSKKCDGFVDCWDRSDENHCHEGCPPEQFSCLNGQCIAKENFCDGVVHCLDLSDEPQGCLI